MAATRNPMYHALIARAAAIPVSPPLPVLAYHPLTLLSPSRPVDLQLKISAPATGTDKLPIILFSHGQGQSNNLSSLNGYGPIVNFWAAHGFVVIQPTHLSSKTLAEHLKDEPGAPFFWKTRPEDMRFILDHLDDVENGVPFLKGRLDRDRIAAAGHSFGGQTVECLLGMQPTDPETGKKMDLKDERIKAGVLLTAAGNGNDGKDLSEFVKENLPFFHNTDFSKMTTPALVVVGDADDPKHLSNRGPGWFRDPFELGTGKKALLTVFGGGHGVGGIAGYDAKESDDESVEMVECVKRMTWGWLRSMLYDGDGAWKEAMEGLSGVEGVAKVEEKE